MDDEDKENDTRVYSKVITLLERQFQLKGIKIKIQ